MDTKITLIKVLNPFDRTNRDIQAIEYKGQSLLDIKKEYFPEDINVVVSLNGRVVKDDELAHTILQPNDCAVFVPSVSGGGGGKNILRTVLMIAVVLASFWAAPHLAPLIFGTATPFTIGVTSFLLTTIGGLLVNFLFPYKPKIPGLDSDKSNIFSWNPVTTQQQGIVVPIIYGKVKTNGNIISGYITTVENATFDQYLHLQIALSEGVIEGIEEIKINEQRLEVYDEVEYFIRDGNLNQSVMPYFGITRVPYNYSLQATCEKATYARWSKGFRVSGLNLWVEVKAGSTNPQSHTEGAPAGDGDVWHWLSVGEVYANCVEIETIANDFDGMRIEVLYPKGLYNNDRPYAVDYQIRIKHEEWSSWYIPTLMSVKAKAITNASVRWSYGVWLRNWRGAYLIIESEGSTGAISTTNNQPPTRVWYEVIAGEPGKEYEEGATDPSIQSYLGCRWHKLQPGEYISTETHLYVKDYQRIFGVGRRSFYLENLPKGKYKIRLIRLNQNAKSHTIGDETWLSAVDVHYNYMFTYPRLAYVGIRVKVSSQLSGALNFSFLVKGKKVRVYNKSLNRWEVKWSDNPAWICYDILTQPVFDNNLQVVRYDGINPNKINLQSFIEWADYCDALVPDGKGGQEKRITFNGIFDSEMSVWDAVMAVCNVGRAIPVWQGNKLSIVVDKEGQAVQMFSVGNIIQDSFKEIYLPLEDRANELEIDFINAEEDYKRDKFIFTDDTYDIKVKSSFTLIGLTKPSEITRFARYQLAKNKYITRVVEFKADIDSIACTVGDIIYVQHDVPQWQYGGRVVSATGNTVTIDKTIYIDKNKQYTIMIRLQNDTIVSRSIVPPTNSGEYNSFTVTSPFTTIPQEFDVFILGETSRIAKPFRIMEINTDDEQKATIIAYEYVPEIYVTDYNANIKPPKQYSIINRFPNVKDLKLDELLVRNRDGTIINTIEIYFNPPQDEFYSHAEIWVRRRNQNREVEQDWTFVSRCYSSKYVLQNVLVNKYYDIKVLTINIAQERQPLSQAPTKTVFTLGKLDPPSDVTGFTATYRYSARENVGYITFRWQHIRDADLGYYQIRMGAKWLLGTIVGDKITTNTYTLKMLKNGTYTFWIKAFDTSGLESKSATSVTVAVTGIQQTKQIFSGTVWQ